MRKIYIVIIGMLLCAASSKAQDTLIYEDFNDTIYTPYNILIPAGTIDNAIDSNWYSFDNDGLADGSGSSRPGEWFFTYPMSDFDALTPKGDSNIVLTSNSWFTSPAAASNYFISPSVKLGDHDTLFWKSAPRQTPRYLDGYVVLLSNTTNNIAYFEDTLFIAAEMTGLSASSPDSLFADYVFGPAGEFVHGMDGLYIDTFNTSSYTGRLRPFSVPLDDYANQTIFFAFLHNSFDDNLITIDDLLIRGTVPSGIAENKLDLNIKLFPNPVVNNNVQLNFDLSSKAEVAVSIYNIAGQLAYSEDLGSMAQGHHSETINTAILSKGFYTVDIRTSLGRSTSKLIVQ